MNPAISDVRALWERERITNPNPATDEDVAAFQCRYGVTLSPVIREYFRVLNGTRFGELGMDDEDLVGFWHLDQIRPVRDECSQCFDPDEPNPFVFADYSIWGWGYAVRIVPEDSATAVFLLSDKPKLLAATFEEFLVRYAARDDSVLYG